MKRYYGALQGALAIFIFVPAIVLAQTGPVSTNKVVLPKVIEQTQPLYPASQAVNGGEVTVVVIATVERDGSVSDATVATSAGQEFDEAAIGAVRTWRFDPATRDGAPIRARVKVDVHFTPPPPRTQPAPASTPAPAPAPAPATATATATATAKETNPTPPTTTEAPGELEVTVIGRAKPPSRGASDFNLRIGELSHVPRKNASDLLNLAPGILLSNEGGEGHAEQVFLRGFDAREGQDIEFTAGGVPINESGNLHGNGYADTHFVLPELVETLRVVEGPFDPRQGNYAVAGSGDYELGLEKRGLTAQYTIGSFGSHRALVLWGPPGASVHTFGGAELYSSDGFGQNRDSKRASAMGQYEGKIGESASFRVTAQAYANTYHSAGVIRDDDYAAGRIGFYNTYDPLQGGESTRYSIAGDIEAKSSGVTYKQQAFAIYRGMRLRENFTGYMLDVQTPLQEPHGQRGDLLDLDMSEVTIGARGSAKLEGKALGQKQELELGYFARGDQVSGTQYRIETATGHPYHKDTDLDSKIGDIALYADAGLRPVSWITVRGGARADLFAYDIINNCAVQSVAHPSKTDPPGDASCLSQQDFGNYREPIQRSSTASLAVMPRGSVIIGPERGFTFNLSAGRGVRSIDPSYVQQDVKAAFAAVTAYEGGVGFAGGGEKISVVARSIFFQTRVDRDLIFNETAGRNILGGATTRTGWVGAVRLTGEHFDFSGNATLVKSTFDDSGLLVPYVPDVVIRSDAAAFTTFPWEVRGGRFKGALSAGITYVGHRPLPYGQRSDALFTIDTSATLTYSHYEVGISVENLLNTQYRLGEYNFASDFHTEPSPTLVPVRHFTAGEPRAIFGTIGVNFGGI